MSVKNINLDEGQNSFYDRSVQVTMKFRQVHTVFLATGN